MVQQGWYGQKVAMDTVYTSIAHMFKCPCCQPHVFVPFCISKMFAYTEAVHQERREALRETWSLEDAGLSLSRSHLQVSRSISRIPSKS